VKENLLMKKCEKFARKIFGKFYTQKQIKNFIRKLRNTVDSRNSGSRFSGPHDLTVSVFGPKELEILIFTLNLAVLSK
jgi:hypothetical protein